jgi:hypothetical protein
MVKGHHAALAAMGIILPSKRHVSAGDLYEPMVRDRDAMGVASQIMQHVFRCTEIFLRINDPNPRGIAYGGKQRMPSPAFRRRPYNFRIRRQIHELGAF